MSKTINLTGVIYNRAGKPMTSKWVEKEKFIDPVTNVEVEEEVSKERALTVGAMLENSLLNRNNSDLTEGAVSYNYSMFKKIEGKEEVELTDEELKTLKQMLCMLYDTYSAGQALEYINK